MNAMHTSGFYYFMVYNVGALHEGRRTPTRLAEGMAGDAVARGQRAACLDEGATDDARA
jgi:hypothetical protein